MKDTIIPIHKDHASGVTGNETENGTIVRSKYWIKTGCEVAHRDHPSRKMYVDNIVKQSKELKDGSSTRQHTFIVGVDCHWLDAEGNYGKGRFLTTELIPYEAA
jgi:uncharacterized protein YodC (DUF2158 family)